MRKLRARPAWADEAAINARYRECAATTKRTDIPHVVDHFYPLHGVGFRGLDVPWNLRVIPATENGAKSNKRPDVFYSAAEFERITRQLNAQTELTPPLEHGQT